MYSNNNTTECTIAAMSAQSGVMYQSRVFSDRVSCPVQFNFRRVDTGLGHACVELPDSARQIMCLVLNILC